MTATFVAQFPGLPGLTLNAQLYDATSAPVGSVITTGFSALPNQPDVYQLVTTIPAGQTGALIVYAASDPTAFVVFDINPQALESSAADVWNYASRTLTSTVPGASLVATIAGTALSFIKADRFDVTITGLVIPPTWSKIYFTIKSSVSDTDNHSLIQIVKSNPGAGGDGLLYLNSSAAGSASDGSLTVDQPGGNIAISLTDDAASQLSPGSNYVYDIKVITSASKSSLLTTGTASVGATPTLAVS